MKHLPFPHLPTRVHNLKSKEPRLRDWNFTADGFSVFIHQSWNQKNLDYEIETRYLCVLIRDLLRLEIKRTSITRLKRIGWNNASIAPMSLKSKEPRLRDWNFCPIVPMRPHVADPWNQKNLDYEIETFLQSCGRSDVVGLEIKRTSITRLKLTEFWKQRLRLSRLEIKRTSITRLKRHRSDASRCVFIVYLKSKEPRLRDWNYHSKLQANLQTFLEIKRTSITRLKPPVADTLDRGSPNLKSKEPRLRDWNPSGLQGGSDA